jgi:hypothetical protein
MIKSSKKVQKVLEEENSKALKRKMEIIIWKQVKYKKQVLNLRINNNKKLRSIRKLICSHKDLKK